jgi:predicted secreted protein
VYRISRLLVLVGLAACAGGSQATVGPDPVEAQDAAPPKSKNQV